MNTSFVILFFSGCTCILINRIFFKIIDILIIFFFLSGLCWRCQGLAEGELLTPGTCVCGDRGHSCKYQTRQTLCSWLRDTFITKGIPFFSCAFNMYLSFNLFQVLLLIVTAALIILLRLNGWVWRRGVVLLTFRDRFNGAP